MSSKYAERVKEKGPVVGIQNPGVPKKLDVWFEKGHAIEARAEVFI